jgi:hypothetical protein
MEPQVPEALRAVTLKAMALERERRYESVEAFAADIEAYQSGFATSAEQAGALRQIMLFVKRNKAVSSAVALFLVAALAFTVKLAASERASRRAAAEAELRSAEAADSSGNAPQIRDSLARVPEDLRTQTWDYLRRRLDSAHAVINAPGESPWITMAPAPDKPGVFYTLQRDGNVRVLDASTGSLEPLLHAGCTAPSGLLVSGDGRRIAVGSGKRVQVFEVGDGSLVADWSVSFGIAAMTSMEGGNMKMRGCLNQDGSMLLDVTWSSGRNVRTYPSFEVWDVNEQKLLWQSPYRQRCIAQFAENSRLMLFTDAGLTELDPRTGEEIRTLAKVWYPASGPNDAATFVADSRWEAIFAVNNDGVLRKTSTKDGLVAFGISAWGRGLGEFKTFQYLPKSRIVATLVATSTEGGRLAMWDSKGAPKFSMPVLFGHNPRLGVHPLSEDLCLMRSGSILVWRLGGPASLSVEPNRSCFIHPKTTRIVTPNTAEGPLAVTENRKPLQQVPLPRASELLAAQLKAPFGVFFCKNLKGDWLMVGCHDRPGVVFRFQAKDSGVEAHEPVRLDAKRLPHFVMCPPTLSWCLSPDGQRLWAGSIVWSALAGSAVVGVDREGLDFKRVGGRFACWVGNHSVAEIAVRKQKELVDGSEAAEKTVLVLWDPNSGKRLKVEETPEANTVEGSPDGKWIAEGGIDLRIRIRDARTLRVVREIRAHDAPVQALKWHHTLPLLVSAGADQWIRIWDPEKGGLVEEFRRLDLHADSLDLSEDGRQLGVVQAAARQTVIFAPACFAR